MKPAVAFFTDSFHEANGVALTSRQFDHFARTRGYPFFSVHAGPATKHTRDGAYESFELLNSRATLRLEHDLFFDVPFLRHRRRVVDALRGISTRSRSRHRARPYGFSRRTRRS